MTDPIDALIGINNELQEITDATDDWPTLRDQFAMAALKGLLAGRKNADSRVVYDAWEIADLMLHVRASTGENE